MRLNKIVLSLFVCLFIEGCSAQEPVQSAEQVLLRMAEVYATTSSYQDVGSVVVLKDSKTLKGQELVETLVASSFDSDDRVSFNFSFRRPEHIRFEWKNKLSKVSRQPVVWANATGAYSWGTVLDEPEASFVFDKESSIKWAIDEETRGSMGVADFLYTMLNGSKENYSFSKMTNAKVIRNESLTGNGCYVILGNIYNQPFVLWIDSQTYLLRRYRTIIATGSFGDSVASGYMPFTVGEFNHREIKLNASLPDSLFDFKPELRKSDSDISNYEDEKMSVPPPLPKKPKT
jgi:outer membrane lipoprotein-sorting protein